ncbi:hypothetical protein B0H13DRAFT_2347514 [Mycena leptocephala]|nr:hypothetical protein B0H13DRAFT_2347514 [Mycena leptocephala]
MDVSESVIDPALLEEASENDRLGPTTDGAIASLSTATSPRPPRPPPAPRTHRFSKEDIESSSASTYAPRRDANESRAEYEQRLMLVTRKAPLSEPCSKLSIKVPKTATLEMLRNELAKYCIQPPDRTSQTHATSVPSRQHPDNTLNFAEPLHFAPPRGILPTVSSTARGEHSQSSQDTTGVPSLVHGSGKRTQRRRQASNEVAPPQSRPRTSVSAPSRPSRSSTSIPDAPIAGPSRSVNFLSSPPAHYGVRPACASSAFHLTRKMRRNTRKKKMATPMNWIKQYGVEGANAEELLGYDDEDDEGGGDDEDEEVAASDDEEAAAGDEEAAHTAFKQTTRVQAVRRAEGNRRIGGIRTQKAVVKDFNEWQTMALKQGEIKDKIIDEHAILHYIEYSAEHEKKTRRGVPIPGSRLGASQLKKLFFGVLRIRKPQDAADPGLAQRRPATTFIVWEALKNRMDEALQHVRNGLDEAHDALDIRANTLLAEPIASCVLWCLVISHGALSNRGDDFRPLKLAELQPYGMTHLDGRTSVFTVLGLQGEEKAGKRGMRYQSYSAFVTNKNPEVCPLGAFAFYHHYIHDVMDVASKLKIDWSIRVLHGPKSPNTPYNEQNLYNLYCRAFVCAGFSSHMKAHLPRHLLGYKQEKMGVDKADTSKLGWVRGATYFDTHAPALPKKAILGAARFKVEETYDPVWTRVHVPQQFLELICPKAESIRDEIANRANLSGAFNYWQMVIDLRPYTFQCGAAIFQKCPKSALFRLPAFCDTDFRTWMQSTFPSELSLLQVKEGSPADLLLIQNAITTALAFSSPPSTPPRTSSTPSAPIFLHFDEQMEETGTYESSDADGTTSIRAFVNGSPSILQTRRLEGDSSAYCGVVYLLFIGFGLAIGAEAVSHDANGPWWPRTKSLYWAFLTVPIYSLFLSMRAGVEQGDGALPPSLPRACADDSPQILKKVTAEFCVGSTLKHPNIIATVDIRGATMPAGSVLDPPRAVRARAASTSSPHLDDPASTCNSSETTSILSYTDRDSGSTSITDPPSRITTHSGGSAGALADELGSPRCLQIQNAQPVFKNTVTLPVMGLLTTNSPTEAEMDRNSTELLPLSPREPYTDLTFPSTPSSHTDDLPTPRVGTMPLAVPMSPPRTRVATFNAFHTVHVKQAAD